MPCCLAVERVHSDSYVEAHVVLQAAAPQMVNAGHVRSPECDVNALRAALSTAKGGCDGICMTIEFARRHGHIAF